MTIIEKYNKELRLQSWLKLVAYRSSHWRPWKNQQLINITFFEKIFTTLCTCSKWPHLNNLGSWLFKHTTIGNKLCQVDWNDLRSRQKPIGSKARVDHRRLGDQQPQPTLPSPIPHRVPKIALKKVNKHKNAYPINDVFSRSIWKLLNTH